MLSVMKVLFKSQVTTYGQLWLCGPTLPASFKTHTSKNRKIQARLCTDPMQINNSTELFLPPR